MARQGAAAAAAPRAGGASGTEREGREGDGEGADNEKGRRRMRGAPGTGTRVTHLLTTHTDRGRTAPHARGDTAPAAPTYGHGSHCSSCAHTHLGAGCEGKQAGSHETR